MTDTAAADIRVLHAPSVTVRRLRNDDLDFAASLHAAALPHGFFARLGSRFLRSYLASFAASPHGVALVAMVDGAPAGMLVGTVDNAAHWSWVTRHHGPGLAARGLRAMLVRPAELRLFLRTRVGRYLRGLRRVRSGRSQTQTQTPQRRVAVLTHVAVDREARGSGVGTLLVGSFLRVAAARGANSACLVTLAGRAGAADFYRRLGWTYNGDRPDIDGRPISVFTRPL